MLIVFSVESKLNCSAAASNFLSYFICTTKLKFKRKGKSGTGTDLLFSNLYGWTIILKEDPFDSNKKWGKKHDKKIYNLCLDVDKLWATLSPKNIFFS